MKRLAIACGGTGGHLAPGIAIAEAIQEGGGEAVLLISRKEVDARLVQKYRHLRFEPIDAAPLSANPLRLLRCFWRQGLGFARVLGLLRRFRPERVVAFGGFTSFNAVLAARLLGVPTALHEANRRPGRAIRWLAPLVERVYVPDGVLVRGVRRTRIRYCGYPVRNEIRSVHRERARDQLGIKAQGKLLGVIGGSQGAEALNHWVRDHFEQLAAQGISVYCLTGLGKGASGVVEARSPSGEPVYAHFDEFSDQMNLVFSACDLAITRAGAGTLAELQRCRLPSILVPYPHAADNHQWHNAAYVERHGGALVLPQDQLDRLLAEIGDLIFNDWLLARLRQNLAQLDRANSLENLLADLEHLDDRADATARSPKFLSA